MAPWFCVIKSVLLIHIKIANVLIIIITNITIITINMLINNN